MSWPKMIEPPEVTIRQDGMVIVKGGKFEGASCREAAQLGMAWAVRKLGEALLDDMTADFPMHSARC